MDIRASDDDRQRTVAALERHAGAGRLTLDELAAVTGDLPTETAGTAVAVEPSRELLILFAVAAATLILLGVFIAMLRA